MKVYVVRTEVIYSGSYLETEPEDLGIFSSKDNAEKFANQYNVDGYGDQAYVYEYELDPTYEEWLNNLYSKYKIIRG